MIERTCRACNTTFLAKKWQLTHPRGGALYCSIACSGKGRTTSRLMRACSGCGVSYLGYKRGLSTYCSIACRLTHRNADKNPNWRGGPTMLVCQRCEGHFSRFGTAAREGRIRFCSNPCRFEGLRKPRTPRKARSGMGLTGTPPTLPTITTRPELFDLLSPPRPIPGFPGYTSDIHGRIIGLKGKPLATKISARGYPVTTLYHDTNRYDRNVHALVALAWRGPRPSAAHVVAHWDGDRKNAAPDNLRWATQRENEADKLRHGTNAMQRLTAEQVDLIRRALLDGEVAAQIARRFMVAPQTIYKIRDGKTWKNV